MKVRINKLIMLDMQKVSLQMACEVYQKAYKGED